ncbi:MULTISPECIES: LacI family DNA-binding transcriptional regulator [Anaerolinea]|uniref:LacI family transcriptional regulator n=1 Tax=Anaerolinea thermophila (strain DSM 14523 / JCM 11388 / NBRC 100420 / UNI-1) TaxID=926569 RepID=E8N5Q4_ANATU|nr:MULTISPECIES: LacI family DNA-binding transcriptional regulator [Anaerolinea]BAJ63768.1 LacI family transcriptional regulator [Anaerolinea thermophila UNI-1]
MVSATRHPTLHDVARLANVSHQTVSRVINNSPNVASETRERVLEAIRILDYHPNRAARSLITGRSQTLYLVHLNPRFLAPVPAIIQHADERGYRVGLSMLKEPVSRDELQNLLNEVSSRIVDGFLFIDPQGIYTAEELNRFCRGVPYIQLGGEPVEHVPAVLFDQEQGMRAVLRHLAQLGHQKIAEVSGLMINYDARMRHRAVEGIAREYGLELVDWLEGDFTVPSGYQLTRQLLKNNGKRFSALICGNDLMALGALRAIHECGLRVPYDISVVGFDDELISSFFEPPLTTVKQDYNEQARVGIEYLLDRIEKRNFSIEHKRISPQLIIRSSTGEINS